MSDDYRYFGYEQKSFRIEYIKDVRELSWMSHGVMLF